MSNPTFSSFFIIFFLSFATVASASLTLTESTYSLINSLICSSLKLCLSGSRKGSVLTSLTLPHLITNGRCSSIVSRISSTHQTRFSGFRRLSLMAARGHITSVVPCFAARMTDVSSSRSASNCGTTVPSFPRPTGWFATTTPPPTSATESTRFNALPLVSAWYSFTFANAAL